MALGASWDRHPTVCGGQFDNAFLQAVQTISRLRDQDAPYRREMADIAMRYNGDFTIPLRDVEGEPTFPAIAASIIADSIDSSATRANDTFPSIAVPALTASDFQRTQATNRKRAWYGHWHEDNIPIKLARAYRHLFGYGTFCTMVTPDHRLGRATIRVHDPLFAYPEPTQPDEIRPPHFIGMVYGRSPAELKAMFPEATALIDAHTTHHDDLWDVLDWTDDGHLLPGVPLKMVGILGRRYPDHRTRTSTQGVPYPITVDGPFDQAKLLRAYPNRAELVPGVCPSGVTLDRQNSALTKILPIVDLLNKAYALNFIASERDIFPDRYVIGVEGKTPRLVNGNWKDGRTGEVNLIQDATAVGQLRDTAGPLTQALLSNLERNARLSGGESSLSQGELSGSVRSGQTVNQLAGLSIDPQVKEAQHIMSYALASINESIARVEKGYFPSSKITLFSGWQADPDEITYTPTSLFDSIRNAVSYAMPGLDAQGASVALGQLLQLNLMSKATARAKHPLIDAGEMEEDQSIKELWKEGLAQMAIQQVQAGNMPLTSIVELNKLVQGGMDPIAAVSQVHDELQKLQASQPPPQPDGTAPPESQPGVNDPNAGGQAAPPGTPPPSGAAGLQAVLAAMASNPSPEQAPEPRVAGQGGVGSRPPSSSRPPY